MGNGLAEWSVIWKEHNWKVGHVKIWPRDNMDRTLWTGEKCGDIFAYVRGHQKVTSVRRRVNNQVDRMACYLQASFPSHLAITQGHEHWGHGGRDWSCDGLSNTDSDSWRLTWLLPLVGPNQSAAETEAESPARHCVLIGMLVSAPGSPHKAPKSLLNSQVISMLGASFVLKRGFWVCSLRLSG